MIEFTPHAQQALALARKEASRLRHQLINTEHLLLGLIMLDEGVVVSVLKKMGIEPSAIRQEVEKLASPNPDGTPPPGDIPYASRLTLALELAGKEARALNHRYAGTEHLLLGLIRESDGVAARVLTTLGIDLEWTRMEIAKELNPAEAERKSFFVPVGEVDLIRQELAVLKSKVETISSTVHEVSQRQPSPSNVFFSLRRLSGPQSPATWNTLSRVLNYVLWLTAFVFLVRMIAKRLRKP